MTALCVVFSLASCEEMLNEEDDGTPKFSDYFTLKVTQAERVGDVLIVDYTLKNKSKNNIQEFWFVDRSAEDNVGAEYRVDARVDGGDWSSNAFPIEAGETRTGSFRVQSFDSNDEASKATLNLEVTADELFGYSRAEVTLDKITFSDNRPTTNGIRTNDRNMVWRVVSSTRDADGHMVCTFSVTNNTGKELKNFRVNTQGVWNDDLRDNLGNVFYYTPVYPQGVEPDNSWSGVNFPAGDTQLFYVYEKNFKENATSFSYEIPVLCDNYTFEEDNVHFVSVRVE